MTAPDTVPWWVAIVWPCVTACANIVLRTRTPEEWVARCEQTPRLAALTRFLRATGLDPVKMVQAIGELTNGGKS